MAQWEGNDENEQNNGWQGEDGNEGFGISRAQWEDFTETLKPFLKEHSVDEDLLNSEFNDAHINHAADFRKQDSYPGIRSRVLQKIFDVFPVQVDKFIADSGQEKSNAVIKKVALQLAGSRAMAAIDDVSDTVTMKELVTIDELIIQLRNSLPADHSGKKDFTTEIIRFALGEVSSYAQVKLIQHPEYRNQHNINIDKPSDDDLYGTIA